MIQSAFITAREYPTLQLANLDIDQFLEHYWQKQPVVLRQAFYDFSDFLDEHDLAGLSEDDDVDSRIIQNIDGQWQVTQGPFDDFAPLCTGKWTLLVQGVDRYLEHASTLMRAFSFIPHWRMDDLMVSFASPGAGVGPHLDQYDVFLVQGKGSRHWKVGKPGYHPTHFPHPLLTQVSAFEPVIDAVLESGDILYIPPGWPHDGVAVEDCLTYSVGFRAPDQSQLSTVLPDIFEEKGAANLRYSDPIRGRAADPAQVTNSELASLKSLLKDAIDSDACNTALLRYLSNQYLPENIPETLVSPDDVKTHLNKGALLLPVEGCRPIYTHSSESFTFFVNGEAFCCHEAYKPIMIANFAGLPISGEQLKETSCQQRCTIFDLFATLINKGYWAME